MTYRRIIIPKGTIISNQTTIIRVPYNLNADAVVVGPKRTTFLESDTLSNALPINYSTDEFSSSRIPDIISTNPEDTIVLPIKIVMPSKKFNKHVPTGRGQIYQTPSKIRRRQIPYDNRLTPWIAAYSMGNSNLLTDVNTQYEDSALNHPQFSSSKVDEPFYSDDRQLLLDQTTNTFPSSHYGNISRSYESYMKMEPLQNPKAPSTIQRSYSDYSRDNYSQINPVKTKFNRFGSPNRKYTTRDAYDKSPYSNRNFDTRRQSPDFYFPVTQNKTEIEVDHNDNLYYHFPDEFSTYVTVSKRDFTQMFPEIAQNIPILSCTYEEDTEVFTEEDDEENKDSEIKRSNPIRSRSSCHQPINHPIREASLINSSEEDSQI